MPNRPSASKQAASKPASIGHVLNDRLTPRETRILAGTPKGKAPEPKPPKK
jgi:hypothetical protein